MKLVKFNSSNSILSERKRNYTRKTTDKENISKDESRISLQKQFNVINWFQRSTLREVDNVS